MSVANPKAASVPPPPDYDVEFRSLSDDAWYSVCTVLDGEKLTLKYQNFSDDDDCIFEVKNFKTLEEVERLKDRFRPISAQLQDNECHKVVGGVVVCASHSFDGSDNRFYDAVVDDMNEFIQMNLLLWKRIRIALFLGGGRRQRNCKWCGCTNAHVLFPPPWK